MADLLSSWGGTDSGTYSPDVIARRAKIAQALLEQATQQQPIQHWTQGLAQMSRALLGGIALNKADTLQNSGDAQFRSDLSRVFSPDSAGPTPPAATPGAMPTPPAAAPPVLPGAGASVAPSPDAMGVVERIAGVENATGNPAARNPRSSAMGDGQFLNGTWLDTIKSARPDLAAGKSDAELLAMRADPALSREMTAAYAKNNGDILAGSGLPVTPGTTYLAHFAGPGGAQTILKADPTTPVSSLLRPEVIKANPFLQGMSAGDLTAWADRKMGGAAPIAQALQAPSSGAGVGPGAIAQALAPPQGGPPAAVPPGAGVMAPTGAATPPGAPMGGSAGVGTPSPIMGPTPAPSPIAPTPATGPPTSGRPEVTPDRRAAIAQLLANPRTPPGIAAMLAGQLNTQFGFQTLPDGTIIRTDPNRGTVAPVYTAAKPPSFAVIGKDTNGNDIHGFVDPITQKITPVNAQGQVGPGAAANSGPNAGLTGEPFLQTLDPGRAELLRAIDDGRMAPPGSFALKSPQIVGMMRDMAQYKPGFDLTSWKARNDTRTDMAKGKMGQNVTSFNTAIGHLDTLSKATDDLGNSWNPTYNTVGNWLSVQKGDPQVTQFNTAKNAVIDELTRAFRGTGGNVHDLTQWEKSINSSASPEQLKAAIKQASELLRSRIEAVGDQYNRGMQKTTDALDLLSPRAKIALQKLSGETGPAPAPPQSATAPAPAPAAAAPRAKNAKGDVVEWNGKEWMPVPQ